MQGGNNREEFVSHVMCDRGFLTEEVEDQKIQQNKLQHPEIRINIGKTSVVALIDTGCNITCINQQWFENNKEKFGGHEELPLTGINVITAAGQKIRKVNKITLIKVNISDLLINIQCIVVPGLVRNLIIGTDLIQELGMEINLRKAIIKID